MNNLLERVTKTHEKQKEIVAYALSILERHTLNISKLSLQKEEAISIIAITQNNSVNILSTSQLNNTLIEAQEAVDVLTKTHKNALVVLKEATIAHEEATKLLNQTEKTKNQLATLLSN